MQHFCHNCGKPVEEGAAFCDNCGTKISTEETVINYPDPDYVFEQTKKTSDHPGDQRRPGYDPVSPWPEKKTSGIVKVSNFIIKLCGILAIVIIILVAISNFTKEDPVTPPANNPSVSSPGTNKKANGNTPQDSTSTALVVWSVNMNAYANYDDANKKIIVDYSTTLKNTGSGNASNINIYFNPDQGDENATYLGISPKTIVNYQEDISQISVDETREIKTTITYSNSNDSTITQEYLQDIANRFAKLPILIEWEENGNAYSQPFAIQ